MIRLLMLAFLSMLAFKGVVFAQSGPVFSDAGPQAFSSAGSFASFGSFVTPRLQSSRTLGRVVVRKQT